MSHLSVHVIFSLIKTVKFNRHCQWQQEWKKNVKLRESNFAAAVAIFELRQYKYIFNMLPFNISADWLNHNFFLFVVIKYIERTSCENLFEFCKHTEWNLMWITCITIYLYTYKMKLYFILWDIDVVALFLLLVI